MSSAASFRRSRQEARSLRVVGIGFGEQGFGCRSSRVKDGYASILIDTYGTADSYLLSSRELKQDELFD